MCGNIAVMGVISAVYRGNGFIICGTIVVTVDPNLISLSNSLFTQNHVYSSR